MSNRLKAALAATAVATVVVSASAPAGIELVARGAISGSALDKSGLTGSICSTLVPANCIPQAVLGGLGSAIAYTGHDNVYVAAPDRGPFDGLTDVPFPDRIQYIHFFISYFIRIK